MGIKFRLSSDPNDLSGEAGVSCSVNVVAGRLFSQAQPGWYGDSVIDHIYLDFPDGSRLVFRTDLPDGPRMIYVPPGRSSR